MKIVIENRFVYHTALGESEGIGGAERQQWLLARALARAGHEIVVYTGSDRECPPREIEGVAFRWVTPKHPLKAWPKILRRERPDWWYRRCSDHWFGILPTLSHRFGTRTVYACAFDTDCTPRKALSKRRYLWPLYALGLAGADRILVQHERQRALLSPALRRKAYWVPSIAGDVPRFERREPYVAWVGLLREPKRPHLLAEIARALPEVRFVVCGFARTHRSSAEYARNITGLLASCPNIELRGMVPPGEAQDTISRAAIFFSTAALEGFPNTFLQAWAAGVPVVSLQLDPGEVISRHGGGIVARDVADAASAVSRLLADQQLNERLGNEGSRYVREHHGEEAAVRHFLEALRGPQKRIERRS